MAQTRLVTASLVRKFHIRFAPGENNGEAVERDLRDQLVPRPGECRLVFEMRV